MNVSNCKTKIWAVSYNNKKWTRIFLKISNKHIMTFHSNWSTSMLSKVTFRLLKDNIIALNQFHNPKTQRKIRAFESKTPESILDT